MPSKSGHLTSNLASRRPNLRPRAPNLGLGAPLLAPKSLQNGLPRRPRRRSDASRAHLGVPNRHQEPPEPPQTLQIAKIGPKIDRKLTKSKKSHVFSFSQQAHHVTNFYAPCVRRRASCTSTAPAVCMPRSIDSERLKKLLNACGMRVPFSPPFSISCAHFCGQLARILLPAP